MTRKKQTRGKCSFCGDEMAKSGLTRHLPTCSKLQEVISTANKRPGKEQVLYHLQVQDAWEGDYWLHLEMNDSGTLANLDHYLRIIWLECCGHMSRFSIGGWKGEEIALKRRAEEVFEPGMELTHIYDFGTSSETLIKVMGERMGKPLTRHPIVLLARNEPPEFCCMECEQPAKWLCVECIYETDESGTLCDEHAEDHPHEEYGEPIPFVNSPRIGMCGYCGPVEPPY